MNAPLRQHGLTADQRHRMRSGKKRWSDEMAARAGAMQCLELRPEVKRLFVYRRPDCHGYHLTRRRGQQVVGEPINAGIQPAKKIPALSGLAGPAGNHYHKEILP